MTQRLRSKFIYSSDRSSSVGPFEIDWAVGVAGESPNRGEQGSRGASIELPKLADHQSKLPRNAE